MRRHILHIRDSSGIFGGERAILTLAKNLDKDLFDLTLLCMRRPDGRSEDLIAMAQGMGIRVESLAVNGRFDGRAILRLRKFIRGNDVSLIHTHDFKSDFYGMWATMGMGVKRVVTAHGSTRDSLIKKAYLFLDERLMYRFFNRVITVSEELREGLVGKGTDKEKLSVIPNGLDLELLGCSAQMDEPPLAFTKGPGEMVFTVAGRLYPDKGQSMFIRAFKAIANDIPGASGLIVGDGPYRGEVLALIESLGLTAKVHYCGVRKNIREIYGLTDFLVIPSFTEGLPYVLLEAMSLGIPVLATSVGDMPRIITHRVTGYLVPAGDVQAMAGMMRELAAHPETARDVAKAGKRLVDETCSARMMARLTEALYRSLTG